MGRSRGNLGCRIEGRETTRKHHTVSAKRGHGLSSPPKVTRPAEQGGNVMRVPCPARYPFILLCCRESGKTSRA